MERSLGTQAPAAPVVIGATGGSGTRVVARILRVLGVNLGHRVNKSEDALAFVRFYDRWIDRFVLDRTGRRSLSGRRRVRMIEDLRRAAGRHLEGAGSEPGQPWGWKNPRSIYVLPLLDEVFTGMRFVHVVRDPRDMAFSGNRNQLTRHGVLYLRPDERDEPPAVQTAVLWQRVNNEARAYGSSMEGRYLLVRYEDLCLHPRRGASDLAAFLGIDTDPEGLDEAAGLVAVPPSIGRWRRQDPALVTRIGSLLDAELAAYGYDDEAWLHRVGELLPPL